MCTVVSAAESDGYPEDWVTPGKSNLYFYPNQQEPAMLCYRGCLPTNTI